LLGSIITVNGHSLGRDRRLSFGGGVQYVMPLASGRMRTARLVSGSKTAVHAAWWHLVRRSVTDISRVMMSCPVNVLESGRGTEGSATLVYDVHFKSRKQTLLESIESRMGEFRLLSSDVLYRSIGPRCDSWTLLLITVMDEIFTGDIGWCA
jgi:hypothetical protein